MTNYEPTTWFEMKPDIYGGDNCDQHIPTWDVYSDGDKNSTSIDKITLDAKDFPPGTKIVISEPVCPKCGMTVGMCMELGTDQCEFDWENWVEEQYS